MCYVVIYAAVVSRHDKTECVRALHHSCIAQTNDLLAEGEGERVCCCSDLVLCLDMSHVLCVGLTDGHYPVSDPNTSLSCLTPWGQLEEKHRERNYTEVTGICRAETL